MSGWTSSPVPASSAGGTSAAGSAYPAAGTYRLVVHDRSGGTQVLGSWTIGAGGDVRYRSGTALTRDRIASIEVAPADGAPILRLTI